MQPLRFETTPQVEQTAMALPDEARAIRIIDETGYQDACSFLRDRCKAVLREVDATFDPIVSAAHRTHKEAVAQKAKVAKPILEAEAIVKAAIATYQLDQARERERLAGLARSAARQLAESETLDRAQRLQDSGRMAEAERILERPIVPAAAIIPAAAPKAAGVSIRETWSARVVDFGLLVAYLADKPEQASQLLSPNMVALNGLARAMKRGLSLPGVEAVSTNSVAVA